MLSNRSRLIALGFVLLAGLTLQSCVATQTATQSGDQGSAPAAEPADPFTQYRAQFAQVGDAAGEPPRGNLLPPRVHWSDEEEPPRERRMVQAPRKVADSAVEPAIEQAEPQAMQKPAQASASAVVANTAAALPGPTASQAAMSRDALLEALRRQVRAEEAPLRAAVINAALAMADGSPGDALDPADLQLVSREQAVNVQRFHQLLVALSEDLSDGDGRLDRQAALAHMRDALGPEALDISDLALCTTVSNFGLYEPLARNTFIAGQPAPVIVYSEVEHFRPQPISGGKFEVRLSQEVVLYEEAGGLDVWRQPAAAVVDQSRNQRRDFYIVQPITLPPNLTVGRYQLKVTIRDEYGGTRAERALPLEVIAGTGLVPQDRLIQRDDPVRRLLDGGR